MNNIKKYHTKYSYDNNQYDFYNILLQHYQNTFPKLKSFEKTHLLLDTLTKKDKQFYSKPYQYFGNNDRKSVFVNTFYKLFDTDYTFLKTYIDFVTDNIKPFFNERKILIQKTPNIRFHLPGYSNIGRIDGDPHEWVYGLHYDNQFNHPQEEWNFVLPITKMYGTNSIFYENEPHSNQSVETYNSFELNQNEFYKTKLNMCKHYNKINDTSETRVSFDFRAIAVSEFENNKLSSATSNIKFLPGKYYMYI